MDSLYLNHLKLTQKLDSFYDLKVHSVILNQHYKLMSKGYLNPGKFIFTDVIMPPELFHAMGLYPIFVESLGSFLASIKMNNEIIKIAEDSGINPDICAYHKCGIGALESKYIPTPSAFIHSSYWCDDMIKVSDYMGSKYNKKTYIVDIPYNLDTNRALDYVKEQFRNLVGFIEEQTGARFCSDKLKEAIQYSNQARDIWIKINKLREEKMSYMYGSDALKLLPMSLSKFGLKENVDVFKILYDELIERKEKGISPVKKARFRLLWLHFFPFYDNKFMRYIEDDLSAVIAFEENTNVYWNEMDLNDPFKSLARKLLSHTGFGRATRRVNAIMDFVSKYKIDGVVHFSQICCRPYRGSVSLIKSELMKKGVPFLELPGDILDSRNYAIGQLKIRIEAFVEILQNI